MCMCVCICRSLFLSSLSLSNLFPRLFGSHRLGHGAVANCLARFFLFSVSPTVWNVTVSPTVLWRSCLSYRFSTKR